MAENRTVLDSLHGRYRNLTDLIYEHSDLRSRDMLFMRRLDIVIYMAIGYVSFCFWGPRIMAKRKPFDLKWTMFAYNVVVALWSLWMFLEFFINSRISNYNYLCDEYQLSYEPSELRLIFAFWMYFTSKAVEFLDTVFMILKKKNSQVTLLHVWHHTFMFPFVYFGVLFAPCCQAILGPLMNSFVHVVMYSYYALSLFPALHPYLWWKKYLTQLQLIQFVILFMVTSHGLATDCRYPRMLGMFQVGFMVSLIVLFSNFYIKSYLTKQKRLFVRGKPERGIVTNGVIDHDKKAL